MIDRQWESIERSLVGLTAEEKREVADRIMESVRAGEAGTDRVGRQREALAELCRKLDAMPAVEHGDGLTNRDHDRIIYAR